jgi:hypothetical protein
MGSLSPVQIALVIIAGVSVLGVIITLIRGRTTYSGYQEIAHDVRRLGEAIKGETFRDGNDLVISGNYGKLPTVVRFSNEENTPGLNIRVQAQATLVLSVVPTGVTPTEGGRVPVKTADEMFDARFTTRTDQPTQAKMFLSRPTTAALAKLCCSKRTFLSIGHGSIELSELVIPTPNTSQHIIDHLRYMARLGEDLRMMPGAEKIKLVPFQRERHVAGRIAIAVGAVVAVVSIFAATQVPTRPRVGQAQLLSSGILPIDAAHIPDAGQWRAATAEDFDPACINWLRGYGKSPEGRIEGDFSGSGLGTDAAYVLVGPDNTRRIVILSGVENRYDSKFPYVGIAARIPKAVVNSIEWVGGKPPVGMDGDGLLIVRKKDDLRSGLVLFLSGHGIVSAAPVDYQKISFE